MKLNYRDRVIIGVLLALALLLAGFFLLIKPEIDDNKSLKETRATVQQEKDAVEAKIAEIPEIKQDITDSYNESLGYTENFVDYNSMYGGHKIDQYLQNFATEAEVKIISLSVENPEAEALDYYYFKNELPDEDMYAQSDVNGDLAEMQAKNNAESNSLENRNVEDIIQGSYEITVTTETKEELWKYMQVLEEQKETILIRNVRIIDLDLKEREDSEENEEEEEKKPSATFEITLFSVFEMQEPNVEKAN